MAVPMLSIKTHVAKSSVLAEKAYQPEKGAGEAGAWCGGV